MKARRLGRPVRGREPPVFQLALQRLELGDVAAEDVDPGLVAPARDHGDPEVASAYGQIETVLETHLLTGEGLAT